VLEVDITQIGLFVLRESHDIVIGAAGLKSLANSVEKRGAEALFEGMSLDNERLHRREVTATNYGRDPAIMIRQSRRAWRQPQPT
jgi:hypothetical protein